jgi:hypothetical protein
MGKMIVFWILTILSISILVGGGVWLFFWSYEKAKKNKMF